MLRESIKSKEGSFRLNSITEGIDDDQGIPFASLLGEFSEAVVFRNINKLEELRATIIKDLGGAEFIDAAATASGFHGVVRIADATGIPYLNHMSSEVAPELDVESFYASELGDRGSKSLA
jgi:hypothetical protein